MRKYVGERLRTIRKMRGLTLREVERRIGYNHSNLSKIELGKMDPSTDLLEQLSTLYETPIGTFFGDIVELRKELEGLGIDEIRIVEEIRSKELSKQDIEQVKDFIAFIKNKNKII